MLYRALPEFEYFEPADLKEAGELLASASRPAVMAGGISLLDAMKRGMAEPPETVVSLKRIPGLRYIDGDRDRGLKLGPLTTIRDAELSAVVKQDFPLLHDALSNIHSVQVKTMGTVVGNVCVGTPASDILTALIALDGALRPAGSNGNGAIPAESLCTAAKRTCLTPTDVVEALEIPAQPAGAVGAYINLTRTLPDIAKLTAAVNLVVDGGLVQSARIAIGAVAPVIIRARAAEDALVGKALDASTVRAAAAAAAADPQVKPITDMRSTAEYRRQMVEVLVRRALEAVAIKAAGA